MVRGELQRLRLQVALECPKTGGGVVALAAHQGRYDLAVSLALRAGPALVLAPACLMILTGWGRMMAHRLAWHAIDPKPKKSGSLRSPMKIT